MEVQNVDRDKDKIKMVEKALNVLDLLRTKKERIGVNEIANLNQKRGNGMGILGYPIVIPLTFVIILIQD